MFNVIKKLFLYSVLIPFCFKVVAEENFDKQLSFYSGVFDHIDDEGDDKTSLLGVEHRNPNLYRDTFFGTLKPLTGAFVTGKSSVYVYTGFEIDYRLGPISLKPSFTPGYYEKGDGKDLGDPLEFKSAVELGINIFENSSLSANYSHISNNDWGNINPGTDNISFNFSTKF